MTAGSTIPRMVISGVGVISPIGIGKDAFWNNLLQGVTGIGPLRSVSSGSLPTKLAAEIHDFNPLKYLYEKKFIKVMSRDIQLGVCAASLAMKDSGLKVGDADPDRVGVVFGAGHIPFNPDELSDAARDFVADDDHPETRWGEDRMGRIAPLWLLRQLPNMPACHVAIEHDARGPNNTITSAEASALLSLQEAMRVIARDQADVMIVGACGSSIHPIDLARISLFEDLSRQADPALACRPFDVARNGTIVGEGAGVFVVERYEHAIARGADIYCEVLGVGAGCDGRTDTGRPNGVGLVNAMQAALTRSKLSPGDIGHINAHGKSTRREDAVEALAYHQAFGDVASRIPVTAMKSYFGTFDAGSGAVELAGSVMALKNRVIPMTLHCDHPDPQCRLNVVREPLRDRNPVAMSVNRTRVGQSVAAVLRAI